MELRSFISIRGRTDPFDIDHLISLTTNHGRSMVALYHNASRSFITPLHVLTIFHKIAFMEFMFNLKHISPLRSLKMLPESYDLGVHAPSNTVAFPNV
jgi:hypothetical protein